MNISTFRFAHFSRQCLWTLARNQQNTRSDTVPSGPFFYLWNSVAFTRILMPENCQHPQFMRLEYCLVHRR